MNFALHILAQAAAASPTPTPAVSSLPDPKSFEAIGWIVLVLAGLAVAFNQGFAVWKNIKPKDARGGNVGRAELDDRLKAQMEAVGALLTNITNTATADRTYAHDKIHLHDSEIQALRSTIDGASEGLHNRLFAQAELLNYLRGQIEGLMMAARASAASADRAAQATERAATRIEHLPAFSSLPTS